MCMMVVLQALAVDELSDKVFCDKVPDFDNGTQLMWFVRVSVSVDVWLYMYALDKALPTVLYGKTIFECYIFRIA